MTYELKTQDLFQLLVVKAGTVSDSLDDLAQSEGMKEDLNTQLTLAADIEPIIKDMLEINTEFKRRLREELE